jgi:transcriptional regulator with XRE-family HTH domain
MPREDPRHRFGLRVRQARLELGLTQRELAARSGLHPTYISSVEMGDRNIGLLNVVRIAEALEVDPAELLRQDS